MPKRKRTRYRVFMTGSSVEDVRARAKEKYRNCTVADVKWDKKKKVPRGAKIRGYNKYYRVYLRDCKF